MHNSLDDLQDHIKTLDVSKSNEYVKMEAFINIWLETAYIIGQRKGFKEAKSLVNGGHNETVTNKP